MALFSWIFTDIESESVVVSSIGQPSSCFFVEQTAETQGYLFYRHFPAAGGLFTLQFRFEGLATTTLSHTHSTRAQLLECSPSTL
jgi:hypothetical protein